MDINLNKKNTYNKNIPMFVINLEKEKKRKKHMQNIATNLNLKFTFIDAVYGRNLDPKIINSLCDHEQTKKILKRELFLGEIGVALSQMSIYQKMLDENIQEAVIFEDDVIIDSSIHEAIKAIPKYPKDWELVLLGYHRHFVSNKYHRISFRNRKRVSKNFKIVRFTELMHGAFGYIINLQGAKKLLYNLNQAIVEPVDHYTGDDKYINLYGISPRCVKIDWNLESTIQIDRSNNCETLNKINKNLSFKGKFKNRLNRFGLLKLAKKVNYSRSLYMDELIHLNNRLKKPKEYK